jgi:hypothetical protein
MYHEILHLDLGADSVNENPNPQTHDLKIEIPVELDKNELGYYQTKVYGPERAKILARYKPVLSDDFETGYYIQRNGRSK